MKRILLFAVIGSITQTAFAQSAEVCAGTPYTIASTVAASSASTYRWVENGLVLADASAATYTVPNNKAAGIYSYVRQAKSADCSEWQSSNEFTVTVFACTFTAGTVTSATATFVDPRDRKRYKTVVMPDGRTWFAQNLNYTKDLTYNAYSYEENGKQVTSTANGVPAIGSYWCPPVSRSVASGSEADCNTYGALYTWETAMMVDGKYADETKTNSTWDESWVSPYYFPSGQAATAGNNGNKNNARGGTAIKGGGRGICPLGWHVPTDREWAEMLDAVEGNTTYTVSQTGIGWWGTDAGKKMKSAATFTTTDPGDGSWLEDANRGTDEFGFAAVPAGNRSPNASSFVSRGAAVAHWSSAVGNSANAWYRALINTNTSVQRYLLNRSHAFVVRCVKD
ncbi:MAG: hypothetical protein LBF69_03300 [Prevotellaceae bacterium]|nr:hypothetical protein [Prevotellaceae bacterium]